MRGILRTFPKKQSGQLMSEAAWPLVRSRTQLEKTAKLGAKSRCG